MTSLPPLEQVKGIPPDPWVDNDPWLSASRNTYTGLLFGPNPQQATSSSGSHQAESARGSTNQPKGQSRR